MDSTSEYHSSSKPSSQNNHHHHPQPSPAHLLSSAKVVAEAAKSTFRRDAATGKIDKTKVAEAAEDLLAGASHYGKLEDKSFGKYVGKAETYLHHYHSSSSTASSTTTYSSTTTTTTNNNTAAHASSASSEESGFGDYLKLAQGFLKKH